MNDNGEVTLDSSKLGLLFYGIINGLYYKDSSYIVSGKKPFFNFKIDNNLMNYSYNELINIMQYQDVAL